MADALDSFEEAAEAFHKVRGSKELLAASPLPPLAPSYANQGALRHLSVWPCLLRSRFLGIGVLALRVPML